MEYKKGYLYHIKDEYFAKANDDKLMQNKEGGSFRPTFYCYRDEKTSQLWMVPLSSRVEKYRAYHDKRVKKYGSCLTIVIGDYAGRESAFLLQNMFPITEYYIDHIHLVKDVPTPVSRAISKAIETNLKQLLRLHRRGKKVVYPDIDRLEQLMLAELEE